MDERQKQLVAAAEALRTWVHAQRAMWAEGYPQSLSHPHPQLAVASVAAPSMPLAVMSQAATADAPPWSDAGQATSQRRPPVTEFLETAVRSTAAILRNSWRIAATIAALGVLAIVVWTVRGSWIGMRTKVSSNLAAGREAVKTQTQALSQRANGDRSSASTSSAAANGKAGGHLQVDSNPSGAHVLIDGRERGVTPLIVDGLALGSHKVLIRGDEGSVQRTISITSADPVQLNEAIYSGWLHVSSPIDIQISEGRRSITLDDSNQVLLAPGAHDVRFENRALGVRQVRHVEIRPGETTAVSLDAPVSHVTVTASEPATVSIDGERAGETPLADYVVPIGTHDVTVTSASGDLRHQTLTVTVKPALVDVDFSKH